MNLQERTKKLQEIKEEVLSLKHSPLYEARIQNNAFPVIGEGNHAADIMFVGEAPGKNEANTGRPFCGSAGRILDELLQSAGIDRTNVYITNIVKDRPPGNRDPFPDEIALYAPFLDRQINIIQPKVLVPLGRFAMVYILEKFGVEELQVISKVHGQKFKSKAEYAEIEIIPMYHPASAIYNPPLKEVLKKDFQILKQYIS